MDIYDIPERTNYILNKTKGCLNIERLMYNTCQAARINTLYNSYLDSNNSVQDCKLCDCIFEGIIQEPNKPSFWDDFFPNMIGLYSTCKHKGKQARQINTYIKSDDLAYILTIAYIIYCHGYTKDIENNYGEEIGKVYKDYNFLCSWYIAEGYKKFYFWDA